MVVHKIKRFRRDMQPLCGTLAGEVLGCLATWIRRLARGRVHKSRHTP